jgi:hypothetical protein
MNGQINIELIGVNGANIVYTGTANDAELKLTNLTGAAINITPGASAMTIVANFAEVYTNPYDQSLMEITSPGWTAAFEAGTYPAWRLTPQSGMQWQNGAALTFDISNLAPNVQAGSFTLTVTIYNYQPFPYAVFLPVDVAERPAGLADMTKAFGASINPATVNVTKTLGEVIPNELLLTFRNKLANAPLVTQPWGSKVPQFTVSFIYSPNQFSTALTTIDAANAFEFGVNGPGWQITKVESSTGPKWLLSPDPATNQQILGTGTASIMTFSIRNVVTQTTAGPTQMYVEWANIPGYADYNVSIELTKKYLPEEILFFTMTEDPVRSAREVLLSWQVNNASLVQLSGVGEVPRIANDYRIAIAQTTTFVLTAIDAFDGRLVTARVLATVEPAPISEALESGTILMWSGAINDLPDGMVLCNGNGGTPDLRDRFIIGAGYLAPREWGAATHIHKTPDVSATITTSEVGDHSHPFPAKWYRRLLGGSANTRTSIDIGGWDPWPVPTQGAGKHTHSGTIRRTGTNTAINDVNSMRPDWYALAYVMVKYAAD